MNPNITAVQRRGPTRSPRNGTDRAVSINGAVNMIAEDVGSEIDASATMNKPFEVNITAERPSCIAGRLGTNKRQPKLGRNIAIVKRK